MLGKDCQGGGILIAAGRSYNSKDWSIHSSDIRTYSAAVYNLKRALTRGTATISTMEKCVKCIRVPYTVHIWSMILESGHRQLNHSTHRGHVTGFDFTGGWGSFWIKAAGVCTVHDSGVYMCVYTCVCVFISTQMSSFKIRALSWEYTKQIFFYVILSYSKILYQS